MNTPRTPRSTSLPSRIERMETQERRKRLSARAQDATSKEITHLRTQNEELRRGITMAVSALEYPASIEEAKSLLNTTLANNKVGGAS